MPTIREQQEALLEKLMEEKSQEAEKQRMLVSAKEGEGIIVHPLMQVPYRWAGKELVQISPRYIDGLDDDDKGVFTILKEAWDETLGQLFKIDNWKNMRSQIEDDLGLGQSPTVLDPWGMPTTHLPISVRKEIEWEEAEHRAMCRIAPFSRECQGELGDYGLNIKIFRVDNLITGRTRWPTYAIPFYDKDGELYLAIGKNDPYLAVEELTRLYHEGYVYRMASDFDPNAFGYDHKMFIDQRSI